MTVGTANLDHVAESGSKMAPFLFCMSFINGMLVTSEWARDVEPGIVTGTIM